MKFKNHQFSNEKLDFIAGISISGTEKKVLDIRVKISNQRVPSHWSDIDYSINLHQNLLIIQLCKPTNAAHFLLEVSGNSSDAINVSYHLAPLLDKNEVLELLAQKSIIFLGCAKNCESHLEASIAALKRIGQLYQSYRILIFENDSTDNTAKLIEKYTESSPIELIQEVNLDANFPLRTQRLSFARNTLLSRANVFNPDYFCVADLDGIVDSHFNTDGFLSNFFCEAAWDAIFPVNRDFYYDIWALRHKEICPIDFMTKMNHLSPGFAVDDVYNLFWKDLNKIGFKNMRTWLSVDSAFGGMGVYKMNSFRNLQYFGLEDGREACEHVDFHKKAINRGAQLFINPNFIVNSH